ncbi:CCA tRNA nucleotidyltransferase [bacterium]|nr:CCA tRNA nucleotidyltransferase [bacterium]
MNLKDQNLYYIGGVVRDEILGLPSFDIDLTYNGNAIEFAKNLPNAEILQINEPFGTVRIKLDGKEIDIASTRNETYPQKGHLPIVDKIGCSLKEDVLRRDFTINAMAKSTLTGKIIDYTGGLNDIKTKTLRVLHDNSFIDDPTRILRMLKFAVRFGFEPDEHTQKLQNEYLSNINYDMSYQRLKKELAETFNLNKYEAFKRFVNQGIYKLISPLEFELPKYDFSPLIEQFLPDNIWIIYVGLLPDISNLPLTKEEKQIVDEFRKLKKLCPPLEGGPKSLISRWGNNFEIYKTFKNIPLESVVMYSTINPEVVEKYFNELKDIEILINGNDLKNLGIEPSPKYQKCFDYILEKKISNLKLSKDDEIKLAKEFFNL